MKNAITTGKSVEKDHIMPKVVVEEETSLQTVSPQGPQGRA